MIKTRNFLWLSSLILAALLLAACGANPPAETTPTEPASADDNVVETNTVSDINEIFGETAVSSDNRSASNNSTASDNIFVSGNTDTILADSEVDANGIPIGFTENGNPYRGNLNAPVVIEEFSDFQ